MALKQKEDMPVEEQTPLETSVEPPPDVRGDRLGMEIIQGEDAEARINPDGYIYAPEAIGLSAQEGDRRLSVVGEIGVPIVDRDTNEERVGHAAIVKFTNPDGTSAFALMGLETQADGSARVVNGASRTYLMHGPSIRKSGDNVQVLPAGQKIVLGRLADVPAEREADAAYVAAEELWGQGIRFSSQASRRQVEIGAYAGVSPYIRDLNSANGTKLKMQAQVPAPTLSPENAPAFVAQHTMLAKNLAAERKLLTPDGKFTGRDIVTRDTTLGGSKPEATVDIRAWLGGGEATVVDPNQDPEYYGQLRASFLQRINKKQELTEDDVTEAIYQTVGGAMKYSLQFADGKAAELAIESPDHRKVNLSVYLAEGKGVCRHMALAAAWLGGEAAAMGLLEGRLTADVNQRVTDNAAHEWARYTTPEGRVWIIDVAQGYVGTLEDSTMLPEAWDYFRPGEREEYMVQFGQLAGRRHGKLGDGVLRASQR